MVYPYADRITVASTPGIVLVDPYTRRVTVDPTLDIHVTSDDDYALWIIAARNLLLIRSVVGSRATTTTMKWWEIAWCLAHAASSYSLPRNTPAKVFSPDGTLLDRVLSLQWHRIPELNIPHTGRIPSAFQSYIEWMDLGEMLMLEPPQASVQSCLLSSSPSDIQAPTIVSGLTYIDVPRVDMQHVQWALSSLRGHDKYWPTLPSETVIKSMVSVQNTSENYEYVLGHVGKREAYRWSHDIPTFYGRRLLPEPQAPWVVYADVSGSMSMYVAMMWSILQSYNVETLYVFSSEIHQIDAHCLSVPTTGTTDYDVVLQHIVDHAYENVIIFSDETEYVDTRLAKLVQDVNIVYFQFPTDKPKTSRSLRNVASDVIVLT